MVEINMLDSDIDDLLRDDDNNIAIENIDADAILGDDNDLLNDHSNNIQDSHLNHNALTETISTDSVEAVKPLNNDNVSKVYPEIVEEQLDYEEDDCNNIKKKQETKVASSTEISTNTTKQVDNVTKKKNENNKKRLNNENSEFNKDSKYYVNPNFKGNFASNKSRGLPFVPHSFGLPPGNMPFSYIAPCPYPSGLIPPHMQYKMNRTSYLQNRGMPQVLVHPGSMIQGPNPVANQLIHLPFQVCHQPPPLAIDIRRNQNSLSENLNQQIQLQQQSQIVQKNLNKNKQNFQSNKTKRIISKSVSPLKKNSNAHGNLKKINTATNASSVLNTLPPVRIGVAAASSGLTSIVATSSVSAPSLAPPAVNINAIVNASLKAPLGLVSKVQQVLPQSKQHQQQQPIVLDRVNLSTPFYQNSSNITPSPINLSGHPLHLPSEPISLRSSMPLNMSINPLGTSSSIIGSTNVTSEAFNWSLMVDAFVKKTTETSNGKTIIPSTYRRSSSRSLSYSSQSRSYSGSSYTRSSNCSNHASERNLFSERSRSPRSPVANRSPQFNDVKKRFFNNNKYQNQKLSKNNVNHHKKKFDNESYKRECNNRKISHSNNSENDKDLMKDSKHTIECAEAIGLDDEYLKKIAEQKRLREEVAKRKSQKRKENFYTTSPIDKKARSDLRRVKAPSPSPNLNSKQKHDDQQKKRSIQSDRRSVSPLINRRNGRSNNNLNKNRRQEKNDSDKIKNESPLSKYSKKILLNSKDNRFLEKNQENMETNFSKNETLENKNTNGEDSNTSVNNSIKMKAYLAVVVSNVKELENSYKKITSLSNSVGSTKKIWQTSENTISIIFTKHEHAKQFMFQYHGKIVNGCRLDVSLEKVFLNLAAML